MDLLAQLGVREHNDENEQMITTVVAGYERNGREAIEDMIRQVQSDAEGGEGAPMEEE